jgi:hypothetical protein
MSNILDMSDDLWDKQTKQIGFVNSMYSVGRVVLGGITVGLFFVALPAPSVYATD